MDVNYSSSFSLSLLSTLSLVSSLPTLRPRIQARPNFSLHLACFTPGSIIDDHRSIHSQSILNLMLMSTLALHFQSSSVCKGLTPRLEDSVDNLHVALMRSESVRLVCLSASLFHLTCSFLSCLVLSGLPH